MDAVGYQPMTKNMDWINLYRQALKEADAKKRVARVEEAEAAMKQVLRMAVGEATPINVTPYTRRGTT